MRTRKAVAVPASSLSGALSRLGQKVLGYIDLFVRTICIILGLVVSGWVKFIDETPTATANQSGMTASNISMSRPSSPLPGIPLTAQPGQQPMLR